MISTRRGFLRGLVAAVAATAVPTSGRWSPVALAATADSATIAVTPVVRAGQAADWEPLGPAASITRLFTPASGPLFAATAAELLRSDDAGATWTQVGLPGPRRENAAIEVDPTDHRVIFADTDDGLQRSDDDGSTWTTIFPTTRKTLTLAISPADPNTLYLAQGSGQFVDFWFSRSRDRGATWEQLAEAHSGASCGWVVYLLTPHPTDPNRLFRTADCYAGRNLSDDLEESRDAGTTWHKTASPRTAYPKLIVGGSGVEPARLIMAADNDFRGGGSTLFTSPDDGATWMPILENQGGGTMTGAKEPSVTIGGLAYNPTSPANVYVGMNSKADPYKPVDFGLVNATNDGGATWTPLGTQPLKQINGLALGIDGRYLFAATGDGVQRIMLG